MSVDSTAASVNHAPPAPQNKGYQNDTLNPYLLYPNENPGNLLVTPLLSDSNYHSWPWAMTVALRSKHKLHFINRSFPRPSNDNHESIAWDECNTMIMSWLSNVVEPEISQSILWMDTDSLASARVCRRNNKSIESTSTCEIIGIYETHTPLWLDVSWCPILVWHIYVE
jgi:hypothetical protein